MPWYLLAPPVAEASLTSAAPSSARALNGNGSGRTAPELSGPTLQVVVTLAKGGVGKTTTMANLAASLVRLNFPVVAINADAGLRNLDLLLGLENRINLTAANMIAGYCRLDQALIRHRSLQGLHQLCLSKPRSKLSLAFGSKTLTWIADALHRSATPPAFIPIDCPTGYLPMHGYAPFVVTSTSYGVQRPIYGGVDAGFVTAIAPAKVAMLVTTPDITALCDADRVAGLLECDGIKDIKIIVNRVRPDLVRGRT